MFNYLYLIGWILSQYFPHILKLIVQQNILIHFESDRTVCNFSLSYQQYYFLHNAKIVFLPIKTIYSS